MAKHRRKKLLARAARADGFSVSTASSPGLFGPQPIPRKAESDDDDESDPGAPAAAPAAASRASGDGKGSKYYQPSQKTLLVGEGDLSFGAALAVAWGAAENLTATVFDDEATAARKYAAAAENASTLRALGARVLYGVDATRLPGGSKALRAGGFDRVVFNFPHAGAGIKDQKRNIETNQALLRGFFTTAPALLASGGEIHVTLAHGPPYDSWDCVLIAKLAGLRVRRCVPFEAARFAGYAHRRTLGDDHAGDAKTAERKSKTYAFGVAGDEPEPTEKERKAGGSKGIQKQRRGPNVKKSRDDERFLKRMRGGR